MIHMSNTNGPRSTFALEGDIIWIAGSPRTVVAVGDGYIDVTRMGGLPIRAYDWDFQS
jgi:hypothetical protein